jgi:hypothetical protein
MYSAKARYYHPRIGRFLSVDPVGGNQQHPQSWNRYAYVLNNPVRLLDSTGKELEEVPVTQGGQTRYFLVDRTMAQDFRDFVAQAQAQGIPLRFSYTFRTTADQQREYDNRAANPNPVNDPGTSPHEAGFAFDVANFTRLPPEQQQRLLDLGAQHGFGRARRNDPPHFQANPEAHGYASRTAATQENQADYQQRFSGQQTQGGAPAPAPAPPQPTPAENDQPVHP